MRSCQPFRCIPRIDQADGAKREPGTTWAMADDAGDGADPQIQATVLWRATPPSRQPAVPSAHSPVSRSQRNPTPLFGLGLIDAIPDAAIEAMAKRQAKKSPEIQGRVSRLKDGRIGRLGWKGQTANVEDFVLNACAVELGLEVPGHHQAMSPQAPKYQTTGLDLNAGRVRRACRLRAEPAQAGRAQALGRRGGEAHRRRQGDVLEHRLRGLPLAERWRVEGIYSDLLLHDMGPEMADEGSYSDGSDDGGDDPLGPLLSLAVADNGRPGPARPTAPRAPPGGNGGRRPSGASATPALISTMAGPRRWSRPSPCTAARARPRREVLQALAPRASPGRGVPQVAGRAARHSSSPSAATEVRCA